MPRRHPLPTLWLLTDERQGDALWTALSRLPRGSGVIARHYGLTGPARAVFLDRIHRLARRKGLRLAHTPRDACGTEMLYAPPVSPVKRKARMLICPVHNGRELAAAHRVHADMVLLSPLFTTRSHPGKRALGPSRFAALARASRLPVIALGGIGRRQAGMTRRLGAVGWAGIDAFG